MHACVDGVLIHSICVCHTCVSTGQKKVCVSERLLRLHPHVSVEMCVLKFCVGFGMCWARGGSVSRELKVLDKTK